MKHICYINRDKVWINERQYDYSDKDGLTKIFLSAKKEQKIGELVVILGNEVSFVSAVRVEKVDKMTRVEAKRLASGTAPFLVTDESFDWKLMTLGEGDNWIQVVVVEPEFFVTLFGSIEESSLKVSWIGPASVMLAEVSEPHETPVLIKWEGKESFSVLALRGMVDLVSQEADEVINEYAKQTWHLAVNPEQIVLNEKSFDWDKTIDATRKKGGDEDVLGISVGGKTPNVMKAIEEGKELEKAEITVEAPEPEQTGGKIESPLRKWLLIGVIVVIWVVGLYVAFGVVGKDTTPVAKPKLKSTEIEISRIASPEASLEASAPASVEVRLENLKIQVLNASGVAGEAGRFRDVLVNLGFLAVDVGNAPENRPDSAIYYKEGFPSGALEILNDAMKQYEVGDVGALTSTSEYDLVILVGSIKR